MITVSFGAAPGSMRPPDQSRGRGEAASDDVIRTCLATEGVADKAQATDDSKEFVEEIEKEIKGAPGGPERWDDFVHLK